MAGGSTARSRRSGRRSTREKREKKLARVRRVGATADTADKYELYQRAVQSPEDDLEFLERIDGELRSSPARHLREDFCGTALLAANWLSKHPEHTAEGFDIDPAPVEWGRKHNFEALGAEAERMQFQLKDVREPSARPPDLRVAFNFSYCCFKGRRELLDYFRAVHADLGPEGLFVLDIHGGPECQEEMEEERKVGGGVTYVWEQAQFWPATAETLCYITFEFKDKTTLRRCFEYDWRLWTLPELKDLLEEAGFSRVTSYWEGDGEDGEGDGEFHADPRGENCLSWIAYVAAEK